jgi:hypothetical protein
MDLLEELDGDFCVRYLLPKCECPERKPIRAVAKSGISHRFCSIAPRLSRLAATLATHTRNILLMNEGLFKIWNSPRASFWREMSWENGFLVVSSYWNQVCTGTIARLLWKQDILRCNPSA